MTLPTYVVPNSLTASTASTAQIYKTLRDALLTYDNPNDQLLTEFVGERVYVRAAPSSPVFPYLTLRLDRVSLPAFNGYRETAILEVQGVGKPESQLPLVESAMDIVDQAMTSLTASSSGLMVCRGRTRQTVPQLTDPADSSVVAVVANYELFLWPRVLTARAV